jgi:asparagine synthase (glutamine-hydrolysing)
MMYNYFANDLVENPCDQAETFYTNIKKLRSAHYFVFNGDTFIESCYWRILVRDTEELSSPELGKRMQELLHQSVRRRLRADVKVGASLSGGLDSSAVVAMMAAMHADSRTYAARFHDFKNDEGYYINIVAQKFHLHHVDVYVEENNLLRDLRKLMHHQEEPFQTGSIYAQYCVYEAARADGMVVMLDGQGADEYHCGYMKDFKWYLRELLFDRQAYRQFRNAVRLNHDLALSLTFRDVLTQVLPQVAKQSAEWKRSIFPYQSPGISPEFNRTYGRMASPFTEFRSLKEALCHQMTHQGLEKLLRFADRNSMAHSLEIRLPYLSHEMVAFVMSLHSRFLLEGGWSKSILRTAMKGVLPDEIVWRRHKIGFEVPEEQWMRNPAAVEMAYSSKQALIARGYINNQYTQTWKCINAGMFLGDI